MTSETKQDLTAGLCAVVWYTVFVGLAMWLTGCAHTKHLDPYTNNLDETVNVTIREPATWFGKTVIITKRTPLDGGASTITTQKFRNWARSP